MTQQFHNLATKTIISLRPGAQWTLTGEEFIFDETTNEVLNLDWVDQIQTKPTKEEIDLEYRNQKAVWKQTEYQRNRQLEYPPLADLADALYWQAQGDESKMTAYLAAVDAIKVKYPKGGT